MTPTSSINCERVKEDEKGEEKGGEQKEEKVGEKGYEDISIEAVGAWIYLGNRRQSVCFLGGGLSQAEVYHKLRRLMNKGRAG